MEQKKIRELPDQPSIYTGDFLAVDSQETNQTGKITYNQLLTKLREDILADITTPEEEETVDMRQQIVDVVYPVGAIYISLNSTEPSALFGGTWVRIEDRFLLGAGTNHSINDAPGGEERVKLSGAESGVAAHNHTRTEIVVNGGATTASSAGSHYHGMGNVWSSGTGSDDAYTFISKRTKKVRNTDSAGAHTHPVPAHTHNVSGGAIDNATVADATESHNNMPPYVVVNIWRRTE